METITPLPIIYCNDKEKKLENLVKIIPLLPVNGTVTICRFFCCFFEEPEVLIETARGFFKTDKKFYRLFEKLQEKLFVIQMISKDSIFPIRCELDENYLFITKILKKLHTVENLIED